jgi:hypothetical protein
MPADLVGTAGFEPAGADVPGVLHRFEEASPELLNARLLLQRTDRKYLLARRDLDDLLSMLAGDYRVLRSAGHLVASYRTVYFDTPDLRTFEDHRRDRRPRCKVRIRHHLDRGLTFLEVKCKGRDGRTSKARLERPFGSEELDADARRLVDRHCALGADRLAPVLALEFRRVTLIGERADERMTIDWDLRIGSGARRDRLPDVAIVEVKQPRFSNRTPSVRALRAMHVQERGISKYCIALTRLAPVRPHAFRPVLRKMEQLSA